MELSSTLMQKLMAALKKGVPNATSNNLPTNKVPSTSCEATTKCQGRQNDGYLSYSTLKISIYDTKAATFIGTSLEQILIILVIGQIFQRLKQCWFLNEDVKSAYSFYLNRVFIDRLLFQLGSEMTHDRSQTVVYKEE